MTYPAPAEARQRCATFMAKNRAHGVFLDPLL